MNKFHAAIGLIMVAAVSACGSSGSNNSPAPAGGGTGGETGGGGKASGGNSGGGSSSGGSNGASTVMLAQAPGAGSGAIKANTLALAVSRIDAFDEEKVGAPSKTPTGRAKMNGYVSVASLRHDSINEEYVVGNLTVDANFDNGTVRSTASDFAIFDVNDIANPRKVSSNEALIGFTGGRLSGRGTIDRTDITSELNGTLRTTRGNAAVQSDLEGNLFDNDGQLVVEGGMSGTITFAADGRPRRLEDGGFIANE